MIVRFVLTVCAVVGLFAGSVNRAEAAPINLVNNGDFESLVAGNSLGSAGGYFCKAGSTCVSNVTGWSSICHAGATCGSGGTVASILFPDTSGSAFNGNIGLWARGQSGQLTNVPVPNSPTGGNFIAFDGDTNYNASISQTITGLTVGKIYDLTFWQAAAQQKNTTGATTEFWRVTFGSQTQDTHVMSNASRGWVPWELQTLRFTATAASQTLTFLSLGTPNAQPPVVLLDGITLTETPEPQTYALVGLALIGIPFLKRRK